MSAFQGKLFGKILPTKSLPVWNVLFCVECWQTVWTQDANSHWTRFFPFSHKTWAKLKANLELWGFYLSQKRQIFFGGGEHTTRSAFSVNGACSVWIDVATLLEVQPAIGILLRPDNQFQRALQCQFTVEIHSPHANSQRLPTQLRTRIHSRKGKFERCFSSQTIRKQISSCLEWTECHLRKRKRQMNHSPPPQITKGLGAILSWLRNSLGVNRSVSMTHNCDNRTISMETGYSTDFQQQDQRTCPNPTFDSQESILDLHQ